MTTRIPGQTPTQRHPHPNRHRRALRSAFMVAGGGIVIWAIGLAVLVMGTRSGFLVSLIVVGVTLMLLAPVWYFTYMERLEPDLYQPDVKTRDAEHGEKEEERP